MKRSTPMKRGKRLRSKPTEWDEVRARLKPLFEAQGITSCEFKFYHQCWRNNGLSFAHSRKRRDPKFEMYEVALACPPAHQALDEGMHHDAMYEAVMLAINARGIIKP